MKASLADQLAANKDKIIAGYAMSDTGFGKGFDSMANGGDPEFNEVPVQKKKAHLVIEKGQTLSATGLEILTGVGDVLGGSSQTTTTKTINAPAAAASGSNTALYIGLAVGAIALTTMIILIVKNK